MVKHQIFYKIMRHSINLIRPGKWGSNFTNCSYKPLEAIELGRHTCYT